ncbi:MAG: hypothetical protein J6P19_05950 [Acetobacter sp.]|nr:hypothetical protein [Acetobacter sp.]
MTLKQNTDFKKRFDEYIEKHSRKTEKNKIKTFMKQIRHGLARGADKKTIFNFFRDEKILTLSYNSFCRYLRELEHENDTQVAHKDHLNVTERTQSSPNKAPQQTLKTTTEVKPEPEKSEALKRVEEHRQRVQAQRAAEATTGTKPEQQTGQAREKTFTEKVEDYFTLMMADTKVYPDSKTESDVHIAKFCANNPRESRKFGEPPEGKALADLPQELQDTIKQEKTILREEQRAIYKAVIRKWTQKAKEAEEKNKFHHDPEAKPPGYWTGGRLTTNDQLV